MAPSREITAANGATPSEIMRMPGLPETPASEHMDIDGNGVISGLS